MATYADVAAFTRALLDDQPGAWADDPFLIKVINAAQRRLVSDLAAKSVKRLRFRLHTVIYVPAGTTSLTNVRSMAPSNLLLHSDVFTITPGPAFVVDKWCKGVAPVSTGDFTVAATNVADPFGTTAATTWQVPIGVAQAIAGQLGAVPFTAGQAGCYVTAAIWLRADSVPMTVQLSAGHTGNSGLDNLSTTANIDTTWRRYSVTAGPFNADGTGSDSPLIALTVDASHYASASFRVARAKVEASQFDSDDILTNGYPAIQEAFSLPVNLIAPDNLFERRVGGDDSEWLPMRGPANIRDATRSNNLRQWDWRGGEILFLGCNEDREVRLDYWADIGQYNDPAIPTQPVPLALATNALGYRSAEILAMSRGQTDKAGEFERRADIETNNLITIEMKQQQAVPKRRRPFLGYIRYPATRYPLP